MEQRVRKRDALAYAKAAGIVLVDPLPGSEVRHTLVGTKLTLVAYTTLCDRTRYLVVAA